MKRDMVMANLFAESEAFVLANRPPSTPPKSRPVPGWVKGHEGGWAWHEREKRRRQWERTTGIRV